MAGLADRLLCSKPGKIVAESAYGSFYRHSQLPVPNAETLKRSDLSDLRGSLSASNGWAAIASLSECTLWRLTEEQDLPLSSQRVYTFAFPEDFSDCLKKEGYKPPLVAVVPVDNEVCIVVLVARKGSFICYSSDSIRMYYQSNLQMSIADKNSTQSLQIDSHVSNSHLGNNSVGYSATTAESAYDITSLTVSGWSVVAASHRTLAAIIFSAMKVNVFYDFQKPASFISSLLRMSILGGDISRRILSVASPVGTDYLYVLTESGLERWVATKGSEIIRFERESPVSILQEVNARINASRPTRLISMKCVGQDITLVFESPLDAEVLELSDAKETESMLFVATVVDPLCSSNSWKSLRDRIIVARQIYGKNSVYAAHLNLYSGLAASVFSTGIEVSCESRSGNHDTIEWNHSLYRFLDAEAVNPSLKYGISCYDEGDTQDLYMLDRRGTILVFRPYPNAGQTPKQSINSEIGILRQIIYRMLSPAHALKNFSVEALLEAAEEVYAWPSVTFGAFCSKPDGSLIEFPELFRSALQFACFLTIYSQSHQHQDHCSNKVSTINIRNRIFELFSSVFANCCLLDARFFEVNISEIAAYGKWDLGTDKLLLSFPGIPGDSTCWASALVEIYDTLNNSQHMFPSTEPMDSNSEITLSTQIRNLLQAIKVEHNVHNVTDLQRFTRILSLLSSHVSVLGVSKDCLLWQELNETFRVILDPYPRINVVRYNAELVKSREEFAERISKVEPIMGLEKDSKWFEFLLVLLLINLYSISARNDEWQNLVKFVFERFRTVGHLVAEYFKCVPLLVEFSAQAVKFTSEEKSKNFASMKKSTVSSSASTMEESQIRDLLKYYKKLAPRDFLVSYFAEIEKRGHIKHLIDACEWFPEDKRYYLDSNPSTAFGAVCNMVAGDFVEACRHFDLVLPNKLEARRQFLVLSAISHAAAGHDSHDYSLLLWKLTEIQSEMIERLKISGLKSKTHDIETTKRLLLIDDSGVASCLPASGIIRLCDKSELKKVNDAIELHQPRELSMLRKLVFRRAILLLALTQEEEPIDAEAPSNIDRYIESYLDYAQLTEEEHIQLMSENMSGTEISAEDHTLSTIFGNPATYSIIGRAIQIKYDGAVVLSNL